MSEGSFATMNNVDGKGASMNSNIKEFQFPEGIRVLSVDEDVVCLAILTALLKKCGYQVTPMRSKAEAMQLLKRNVDNFDIVLTNLLMDEIDGFKLLQVGLELDIPVIMISACDTKEIMMKGIQHGAVSFLPKPVQLEALRLIWQHVYRKHLPHSKSSINDACSNDFIEETQADLGTNKSAKKSSKRKSSFEEDNVGSDQDNAPSAKRERIKWTHELHNKFLSAIDDLGGVEHAVPKKILEHMKEQGLSREKVASHLQKYRKLKKRIDCDGNAKPMDIVNNHKEVHFPLHSSIADSSMGRTSMYNPPPFMMNNTSRGFFVGPNHSQSPNNSWLMPLSFGDSQSSQYRPSSMTMQQQRMMPFDGNFVTSGSSSLLDQQHQQRESFDTSLTSGEFFDHHGPSVIDPLFEPLPSNIYGEGYPALFDDS